MGEFAGGFTVTRENGGAVAVFMIVDQITGLPGAQAVRTSFVLDKMISTAPLVPPLEP